jgi:hypothetical protein
MALGDNDSVPAHLAGGAKWSKRGYLWGAKPTKTSISGRKWGTSPLGGFESGNFFLQFKH